MSRSSQRSGPTPAGDDEPEVEDVEVRTIVYDDVDGDVVDGRLLPAPQAATSPVAAATPFAPVGAIVPPPEPAVVEPPRQAVRAAVKPPAPAVAAKAPPAVAPRPAAPSRSRQLAAAAADVAAAVRPAPAARTDDADRPARSAPAARPAHATPARVSDKTPSPDAVAPARRLPETAGRSSTSASSKPSSRSAAPTSSRPPQEVAATKPASAPSRQSSQSSTRMDVLRRPKSSADAPVEGGVVCPFCAHVRAADAVGACPRCTMEDSPSTRRNTGERIGPWFVLQRKNPTAPGLRFHVILALVKRGHVTGRSIVRGPTTGQLWRYATEVKGLSRLFGTCWHCHADVAADDAFCPRCKSAQEPPDDPDAFIESQAELPLMEQAARVALDETPARAAPPEPTPVEPALSTALDDAAIDPPTRERARPSPAERPAPPVVASSPRGVERAPAVADTRRLSKFANLPEKRPAAGAIDPMLSATELAAVFQMPAPPRPSLARRTGRRLWKTTKVASLVVLFLATAGTVVFTVKPELREPARQRVEPLVFATRDAAIRAGAWSKEQWNVAWAAGARAIARLQETPTTVPTLPDESSAPAGVDRVDRVAAPANDRPATDDLPPATPIRPDPAASPVPEARRDVPPGGTSITDVSPTPAVASPEVASPTVASIDGEWDALMTRDDAATRPTADRTIAANPPAPLDATPPDAIVAAAPTSRPASPEARAAQLDETADALLREADRVLAEAQAAAAAAGAAPRPQASPKSSPRPTTPTAAAPNASGVTAANGVATGQSSQTVDPTAPRPAPTPAARPAAPQPTSLDQAIAQAATLRQQAFDAEARRDWPAAVKLWRQIAELPEDARPSDVRVRLALAEDRAKR